MNNKKNKCNKKKYKKKKNHNLNLMKNNLIKDFLNKIHKLKFLLK